MGRQQRSLRECHPLSGQRTCHAPRHKLSQALLVHMLKLTAATRRKMDAGRCDVVKASDQSAVVSHPVAGRSEWHVPPIGGDAIAFCGNANYKIIVDVGHRREAIAAGSCAIKSSATNATPERRAASP